MQDLRLRLKIVARVSPLIMIVACSSGAVAPRGQQDASLTTVAEYQLSPDLQAAARSVIADVVSGARSYGNETDRMLRVETKVAGFGGFFIANGRMNAVLKNLSDSDKIRNALDEEYSARSSIPGYEAAKTARNAGVTKGNFSLSELIAVQNKFAAATTAVDGVSGSGISYTQNRLKIGFVTDAARRAGLEKIDRLALPRGAIAAEVWGPIVGS